MPKDETPCAILGGSRPLEFPRNLKLYGEAGIVLRALADDLIESSAPLGRNSSTLARALECALLELAHLKARSAP